MIITIDENYLQKYHQINNQLGIERNKIGNLLIKFEEEKEETLNNIKRFATDLENHLVNLVKKYERELKHKVIKNVDIEKGIIEYTEK